MNAVVALAAALASVVTASVMATNVPAVSVSLDAAGSPARAAATALPCRAPSVFVESQAWWKPAPGAAPTATDFGHVHLGACVPERDVLRSKATIPVRLIMHENPGRLRKVSLVVKGTDYEETIDKIAPPRRMCPVSGTCEQWIRVSLDPKKFRHSGLQEVRLRAYVDEPDGNLMHTSLNWQVRVMNGKSRDRVTRHPYLRGKGWYTDFGYCEADVLTRPLPDRAISGDLVLKVRQADHGPDDVDPTHHLVAIDSDAHAGLPGTVVLEGDGPLGRRRLTIDTTKLSDGAHRLVQRVDCRSGDQISSGVLVLVFTTENH